MEMRNCPRCKRIFNYTGFPICQDCVKEDETVFEGVRTFIKENPDSALAVISEKTGVSAKKILRYVREGRLEVSKGMHGEVVCANCGKPITKGKYCDKCVIELNNKVDQVFTGPIAPVKMHTKQQPSSGKGRMYTAEKK